MSLNYALGNELRRKLAHEDGYAVVRLDTRGVATVSYTHLDVYKRQPIHRPRASPTVLSSKPNLAGKSRCPVCRRS